MAGLGCLALALVPLNLLLAFSFLMAERPGPDGRMIHTSDWVTIPTVLAAPALAITGIVLLVHAAFRKD
ncbi:MAG: hypothetical protein H0W86_03595 [Armatimonadetes bacterium]|nr:hypothetical protein [Armatimonadota bacterium]